MNAVALREHAWWLEDLTPPPGDELVHVARIEHVWALHRLARDGERRDDEHDTVPRISVTP